MGGYRNRTYSEFVHKDDACPVNDSGDVCSSFDTQTQAIAECVGHRNVNTARSMDFQEYGPGSVVHNSQPNSLRRELEYEIIQQRKLHIWYADVANLDGLDVQAGEVVRHGQENVINDCIQKLNNIINDKNDWGISQKNNAVSSLAVLSGDQLSAENLKFLERNLLSAYRDCICYSDCTCHGLSVYTVREWCGSYGSGY